jgi:CHAD domain-containing protein
MVYVLQPGDSIPAEIHRVMREQLDRMEAHLRAREVHEMRKRVKETRSLLRLIRKPLGATFAVENDWYGSMARELSAARDAEAVGEAIERLMKATEDTKLHERLAVANERIVSPEIFDFDPLLQGVERARSRLADWPHLENDFDTTLAGGLRRTLRRGRKALARAGKTRKAEDFHELRKRVKDHWYHTRLVAPFQSHAERVEHLSHVLGHQHDLVITVAHIDDDALLPLINHERKRLEREALDLAEALYDESPKQWCKRVRKYWPRRAALTTTH